MEFTQSIPGKRARSLTFIEPWHITWRSTRRQFQRTSIFNRAAWVRIAVVSAAAVGATAWAWRTYAPGVPMSGWVYAAPLVILGQIALAFSLNFLTPRFVTVNTARFSTFQGQYGRGAQAAWITHIRIRPTTLGAHWLIVRYQNPRLGTRSIRAAIPAKVDRDRLDAAIAQLLASRDQAIAAQAKKADRTIGRGWFARAR